MLNQIPKRIIQTGKKGRESVREKAAVSTLRLLHPDFEYLFFDDEQVEEFIKTEFPEYWSVFSSFAFRIQRYDFFRYLAIYRYGGFYFDLDVLLASNVSGLLESGCVFPFEGLTVSRFMRNELQTDWFIGNYAFGATSNHEFLKAIIDNCVRGLRDPNWVKPMMRGSPPLMRDEFFVLNSTGPGLVSRTLAESGELAQKVRVLFPDNVCDVHNWNRFGDLGVHLVSNSWRPTRSFISRKFSDLCWRWIDHRGIKESLRLGNRRSITGHQLAESQSR